MIEILEELIPPKEHISLKIDNVHREVNGASEMWEEMKYVVGKSEMKKLQPR